MTGTWRALAAAIVTCLTCSISSGWPEAQKAAGVWASASNSAASVAWCSACSLLAAANSGLAGFAYSWVAAGPAGPGPPVEPGAVDPGLPAGPGAVDPGLPAGPGLPVEPGAPGDPGLPAGPGAVEPGLPAGTGTMTGLAADGLAGVRGAAVPQAVTAMIAALAAAAAAASRWRRRQARCAVTGPGPSMRWRELTCC
jgi:hypothetical protein